MKKKKIVVLGGIGIGLIASSIIDLYEDMELIGFLNDNEPISPDTRVSSNCILLPNSFLGHNSSMGEYSSLATNSVVGAHVEIGKGVHIGSMLL